MPKESYYITKNGTLRKKHNTVWFENSAIKKVLPVEKIDSLYCLGEVSVNAKLLGFLAKNGITVHFFNYYGFYTGTFYPKESLVSGFLIVNQVKNYLKIEKRLFLAKEFVTSTQSNLVRILEHFRKHGKKVKPAIDKITQLRLETQKMNSIEDVMNKEGLSWKEFYGSYSKIINPLYSFGARSKRPPENEINCLISFLNQLLYTRVLTEIYHTQLNPAVSYLHEPFERRFSLCLDISEMFKPLITQRALLKLLNKNEIKKTHFKKDLNGCMLNEYGRQIVLKEFDSRIKKTVKHPTLNRLVSYRRLMRIECYKLIKHLLGEEKYEGFKIWW